MDILSHGLWGSIIFGRKNKKSFWASFLWGIAPDFLSFGIFTIFRFGTFLIAGASGISDMHMGRPNLAFIPQYVHSLYNITHSFVVFIFVFSVVWCVFKKPIWEMLAWPFHIFLDLFTHSTSFFPTPYLWPFTYTPIDGIPWSTPIIFFTNVFFLILIYTVFLYKKMQAKKTLIQKKTRLQ